MKSRAKLFVSGFHSVLFAFILSLYSFRNAHCFIHFVAVDLNMYGSGNEYAVHAHAGIIKSQNCMKTEHVDLSMMYKFGHAKLNVVFLYSHVLPYLCFFFVFSDVSHV